MRITERKKVFVQGQMQHGLVEADSNMDLGVINKLIIKRKHRAVQMEASFCLCPGKFIVF